MGVFPFVIPWVYLVVSRLKTNATRLSWVLVNPVVIVVLAYAVTDLGMGMFVLALALAFVAWQSVYETGYLENDLITTQREVKPTLRIDPATQERLMRRYRWVVTGKFVVAVGACAALLVLKQVAPGTLHISVFVLLLVAVRLVFLAHNTIRSRLNIATYFGLAVLKYGAIPALVFSGTSWGILVVGIVLLFPLLRTLEHASKVKYHLPDLAHWVGDFDRFRPRYYGALVVMLGSLALWTKEPLVYIGLGVAVYLLVIRIVGLLVRNQIQRQMPEAYVWETEQDG